MKEDVKAYLASIGRRGGKAGRGKAKARTKSQARKAALARWRKRANAPDQRPGSMNATIATTTPQPG